MSVSRRIDHDGSSHLLLNPRNLYFETPSAAIQTQRQVILETRQSLPFLFKLKVKPELFNRYIVSPKTGIIRPENPVLVHISATETTGPFSTDSILVQSCFISAEEANRAVDLLWADIKEQDRQLYSTTLTIWYSPLPEPHPHAPRKGQPHRLAALGHAKVRAPISPPTSSPPRSFPLARSPDVPDSSSVTPIPFTSPENEFDGDAIMEDIGRRPHPPRQESHHSFVSILEGDLGSDEELKIRSKETPRLPMLRPPSPMVFDFSRVLVRHDSLSEDPFGGRTLSGTSSVNTLREEKPNPTNQHTLSAHSATAEDIAILSGSQSRPSETINQMLNAQPNTYTMSQSGYTSPAESPWIIFLPGLGSEIGRFRRLEDKARAYGGFSDVWYCEVEHLDGKVAEKELRAVKMASASEPEEVMKRMRTRVTREMQIWRSLKHENVAPLLGYTFEPNFSLLSHWYDFGNIKSYLSKQSVDAPERLRLCHEVANGLAYLHSRSVIHGDIKSDNVMIKRDKSAVIIDFGLSKALKDVPSVVTSLREAGLLRWMAPELAFDTMCAKSTGSDVWSFGCLALEVITGLAPFEGHARDIQVVTALQTREKPFPASSTHPLLRGMLRDLLFKTWLWKADDRPSMDEIKAIIGQIRNTLPT